MLTFDEGKHVYQWNGITVPGVTLLLDPIYDFRFVKEEYLERARVLGKAVHKTIELAEAGRLDEEKTNPVLLRYLAQWRDFKATCGYVPTDMGKKMFSEQYGYAGTDDTYGMMSRKPILIDLKTGDKYAAHELQTAAYKQLRVENGLADADCGRGSIYLREDGFELKFHTDANDRTVFLGMLTQYRWRQKHGK